MKEYQDKEVLENLHWEKGLSMREIGKKYDVTHRTIGYWFDKHGLKRRGVGGETPHANYLTECGGSDSDGYVFWRTKHQGKEFRVRVHRLLAVAEYGFEAVKDMEVHHMNTIKWDNRSDNIVLLTSSEHAMLHAQDREYDENGFKSESVA